MSSLCVEPILLPYFIQNSIAFSEDQILTILMSVLRRARTLPDLSTKYILAVHLEMTFSNSDIVVHPMSTVIPDTESSQLKPGSKDKVKHYFIGFLQFDLLFLV